MKITVIRKYEIEVDENSILENGDIWDFTNKEDVLDWIETSYDFVEADDTDINDKDFTKICRVAEEDEIWNYTLR